jgi:hypothetical protein
VDWVLATPMAEACSRKLAMVLAEESPRVLVLDVIATKCTPEKVNNECIAIRTLDIRQI